MWKAFFLINMRARSQAPPTQALVTSGVLEADVADPSCLLITYVFIQISAGLHSDTGPLKEERGFLMKCAFLLRLRSCLDS